VRVGLADDPDSLFGGLQWRVPLAQVGPGRFLVQPGVDIGIVDGPIDFFLRGTLHLGYMIPISNDFSIYPLAGPALIWTTADDNQGNNGSDTNLGIDVGVGAQFKNFALELWVGAVDSFDLTLGLSFNL
jgi:hypothetical protein